MSAFTFFKALEKLSHFESDKKKGRIKIPDYFIKLLLMNKNKLYKEQINKKILEELFRNRHLINKNFNEPKNPNFFLANQKYKSLQKISRNLENVKSNSPLPKIDQSRLLLNLRYKENPRDYSKFANLAKGLISLKSKRLKIVNSNNNNSINNANNINNSTIKTESVIPNKNVKEIYFIAKKENNNINNSSENKKNGTYVNSKNNKSSKIITTELNFDNSINNNLRMTFITPLSRSMNSKKFEKYNGTSDLVLNNSSKKLNHKNLDNSNNNSNNNSIISKNLFPKLFFESNENSETVRLKKNCKLNLNLNNDSINNQRNNELISEYNLYHSKNDKINHTYKEKDNTNSYKKMNLSSILEIGNNNTKEDDNVPSDLNSKNNINKINNNNNNNINMNININLKKRNLKDAQLNMKPLHKTNFYSSNNINNNVKRLTKISLSNNAIKNNNIVLIPQFEHKYITQEDFEKKISKKIINYPPPIYISPNNSNDKFYYFINKMYRNQLIEYMKHRINWELVVKINPEEQKTINFAWKYMSNRLNFKNYKYEVNKPCKKLKMVNLFERNYEVGNKKNMFINLINYCDQVNINVFNLVPFTIIINNTKEVDSYLDAIFNVIKFVNKYKNIGNNIITNKKYGDYFWFDKNFDNLKRQYINIDKNFLSDKNYWILKPTDLYQGKCIEISNSYEEISKKCRNMFKGVDKRFIPELITKEDDLSDDENGQNNNNIINNNNSSKILATINEEKNNNDINNNNINKSLENKNNNVNNTNNNLINNTSNNINNITNSNKKKAYSKMYCSNEIIIQKYLDNPLLYYNRKFDIRCFVLVDSNLNIFFCKEGHLKASSEFYDLSSTNKLIHITNYSLQKKSSKFEQYEDGNEISYNDFKKFLGEKNISLDKFNDMISQMKYLVEISFKSVGKKMLKTTPVLCFEIFGYDFIIDNDFKPWILEINNNPGLCISSPVIQKLVPRMLDDAFRLTIDKVFDTKYDPEVIDENGKYKSKYKIDGFTDEENIFEFLCNAN